MELILDVDSISYSYGEKAVFEDISFSLKKGEVMCILGQNGAGKSTLIKCISGVFKPKKGKVRIMGQDTEELGAGNIARYIGYVPQQSELVFPFTVLDFVVMGRTPHLSVFSSPGEKDIEIARRSLEMTGTAYLAERTLNSLSGGQRQMIFIARALAQEPALLLLDEPTSHLDFGNQVIVLEMVQKLARSGIAVLMNTHTPDHAFLIGNSAAALSNKELIAIGAVDEVVNSEVMSSIYGVSVSVCDIEDMKRKVCVPQWQS